VFRLIVNIHCRDAVQMYRVNWQSRVQGRRQMIYVELAVVVVLIAFNGMLAMAELAVVSSRRGRLQTLVNRGVTGSRRALALASDPGRFLSTVQIGITLVGVLSGAFSGATLGVRLGNFIESLGVSPTVASYAGMGIVVAVITYMSLIIGELVPKQIALRDPEGVAVKAAPAMTLLARIGAPLVWLLDVSGDAVLRLLGYRAKEEKRVSDEEIRMLIAEAESAGVIEPGERAMISGVMRFGDRAVRSVMTPRTDVDMIDLSQEPDEIRNTILRSSHSRFPTHNGNADEIVGVVQVKDILDGYLAGHVPDIRDHLVEAPVMPDTVDALTLVEVIKQSTTHMVLVHDEYGHFEGLVTNADILGSIVGYSLADSEGEEHPAQRADGSWLIPGSLPADEMANLLFIALPADRPYHTAAGFALSRFGHLPTPGDHFEALGWRFEVVDLDGRRIDKMIVSRSVRRPGR
jgi:putative hemolysin